MDKNILRLLCLAKNQREFYQIQGKYFGYPKCCIESFIRNKNRNDHQLLSSKGTGFLPCKLHAKQIIKRKIKLEELLQNRLCKEEFPNDR